MGFLVMVHKRLIVLFYRCPLAFETMRGMIHILPARRKSMAPMSSASVGRLGPGGVATNALTLSGAPMCQYQGTFTEELFPDSS